MLSKEEFMYHINAIEKNSIKCEFYKKKHPNLAEGYLKIVELSKKILIKHYEDTSPDTQVDSN